MFNFIRCDTSRDCRKQQLKKFCRTREIFTRISFPHTRFCKLFLRSTFSRRRGKQKLVKWSESQENWRNTQRLALIINLKFLFLNNVWYNSILLIDIILFLSKIIINFLLSWNLNNIFLKSSQSKKLKFLVL